MVAHLLPEPSDPVGCVLRDVCLQGVGYEGPPTPGETGLFLNTALNSTGVQRGRMGLRTVLLSPPSALTSA